MRHAPLRAFVPRAHEELYASSLEDHSGLDSGYGLMSKSSKAQPSFVTGSSLATEMPSATSSAFISFTSSASGRRVEAETILY
eukprot:scaffold94351_cov72-Phaeocystis_antarctica.AAC.1